MLCPVYESHIEPVSFGILQRDIAMPEIDKSLPGFLHVPVVRYFSQDGLMKFDMHVVIGLLLAGSFHIVLANLSDDAVQGVFLQAIEVISTLGKSVRLCDWYELLVVHGCYTNSILYHLISHFSRARIRP